MACVRPAWSVSVAAGAPAASVAAASAACSFVAPPGLEQQYG